MFVCCKRLVIMLHPEILKDMKPHFNQMSTPHWIILIVTNVFPKQVSVIAVFKCCYIFFADSTGGFFPPPFWVLEIKIPLHFLQLQGIKPLNLPKG